MAKKKFDVRHFDANEKQQIDSLLQQLSDLLVGRLDVEMTADDRRRYGSVNEQNKLFINKILALSKSSPHLKTPSLDWGTFEAEHEQREYMEQVLLRLMAISYDMQSTKIALDNNNYNFSLLDYRYTDILDAQGVVGVSQKIEELSQFFPGRPKKSDEEDESAEKKDEKETKSSTEEKK